MKKALLLLVVGALAASALAQKNQKDSQAEPLSTTACQSTFTSGSGNAYLKFCVTQKR